jgi:hypothetical protein
MFWQSARFFAKRRSEMTWKVEEIKGLKGFAVEHAEAGKFILSKRNQLFHSADLKQPFKPLAVIDAPSWKVLASNFRLAQRLLRFMVTNVVPLANGDLFVTFDKTVGIIRNGKYQTLSGLVRPCRVLRSACASDDKGDIFFGEYLANSERGEVRIYKYEQGSDNLEVAYTFARNTIKHIHGIYFDKFTNSLFCLTGDAENECQILRSNDDFQTIEVVGKGDETWRAVSILFDEDSFYFGMDAEFTTNFIYRMNRLTGERKQLGEVNGTVFYAKKLGDDLFFTTTAENAPSQTENTAAIWRVDKNGLCEKITAFEKDGWHGTLFMFGTIHFPATNNPGNETYFQIVGVKGDGKTFRLYRNN